MISNNLENQDVETRRSSVERGLEMEGACLEEQLQEDLKKKRTNFSSFLPEFEIQKGTDFKGRIDLFKRQVKKFIVLITGNR